MLYIIVRGLRFDLFLDLKKSICSLFGKKYNIGDRFTNPDCSGMCKCTGSNNIECVSLCPPVIVKCSANERLANMIVPAFKGSECTCTVPECVPESKCPDLYWLLAIIEIQ